MWSTRLKLEGTILTYVEDERYIYCGSAYVGDDHIYCWVIYDERACAMVGHMNSV